MGVPSEAGFAALLLWWCNRGCLHSNCLTHALRQLYYRFIARAAVPQTAGSPLTFMTIILKASVL